MPKKKKSAKKLEDPRPITFDTGGGEEYFCMLADLKAREKAGELRISTIYLLPDPGVVYRFKVEYYKPYLGQQELI